MDTVVCSNQRVLGLLQCYILMCRQQPWTPLPGVIQAGVCQHLPGPIWHQGHGGMLRTSATELLQSNSLLFPPREPWSQARPNNEHVRGFMGAHSTPTVCHPLHYTGRPRRNKGAAAAAGAAHVPGCVWPARRGHAEPQGAGRAALSALQVRRAPLVSPPTQLDDFHAASIV